jgi:hypothetical protein
MEEPKKRDRPPEPNTHTLEGENTTKSKDKIRDIDAAKGENGQPMPDYGEKC